MGDSDDRGWSEISKCYHRQESYSFSYHVFIQATTSKSVGLHCPNNDYLLAKWSETTKTAPNAYMPNCIKAQDTNFRRKGQWFSLYHVFYRQ